MTLSDDQLVRSVRESVDARTGAGVPVEQIVRRGRRRTAVRRSAAGAAVAVVAVAAVALSLGGLPLLSSAPPARQPSVTLTPDPSRTSAERPVTDLYAPGEAAVVAAGLVIPDGARWGVAGGGPADPRARFVGGVTDSASIWGDGFTLETALMTSALDPGATGCSAIARPETDCRRTPQPDGTVLFELGSEGEFTSYRLLHDSGYVGVDAMDLGYDGTPVTDPPTAEQLRELVLDPDLRW